MSHIFSHALNMKKKSQPHLGKNREVFRVKQLCGEIHPTIVQRDCQALWLKSRHCDFSAKQKISPCPQALPLQLKGDFNIWQRLRHFINTVYADLRGIQKSFYEMQAALTVKFDLFTYRDRLASELTNYVCQWIYSL